MDAAATAHAVGLIAGAECLTAALLYLELGWPALALCPPDHVGVGRHHGSHCAQPGKSPIHDWKAFQSTLPLPGMVNGWWKQNAQANVGVAMGGISGLIGLDPDGPAGETKLQELSAGDLPPTLEFSTPGGGRRLLYRIPTGADFRPTYLNLGVKEELRFLGTGAQTVMPPSRHRSGGRYQWREGHGPNEIQAAPAPAWLVQYMTARPRAKVAAQQLAEGELVPEGRRHSYLLSLGGTLRARGFGEAAILAALTAQNEETCDPPLDAVQVKKLAASMMKYEAGHPPIPFTHSPMNRPGKNGTTTPTPPLAQKEGGERWRFTLDGEPLMEGTPDELTVEEHKSGKDSGLRTFPIYSLPGLIRQSFPAPNWVVPGLLSEGLNILAGSPKIGKSMLALNLSMTVAAGGLALGEIVTRAGDVLYLALEDTARRVQDRAKKILGPHGEAARRFSLATRWPSQQQGGLSVLKLWLEQAERPTLVIIDVWGKFRREVRSTGSQYEQDYRHLSEVKEYLDDRKCNSLVLMHTRKATADDAVQTISGTQGLSGVADGVLVLNRNRGENEAKVFLTGRDVQETELALQFDPERLVWRLMGTFGDRQESKVKEAVLRIFQATPGAAFWPAELAALTAPEKTGEAARAWAAVVKTTVWRMERDGVLQKVGGRYQWPADSGTVTPPVTLS